MQRKGYGSYRNQKSAQWLFVVFVVAFCLLTPLAYVAHWSTLSMAQHMDGVAGEVIRLTTLVFMLEKPVIKGVTPSWRYSQLTVATSDSTDLFQINDVSCKVVERWA
jgi:hypothetical protein